MNDINREFKIGNRLRNLRILKGYSQEYIADILKICQKTYSNMENNKCAISVETLKKIAKEYKIDFIELISEDKEILPGEIIINHLSEELLNQLKERIEDLKKIISEKDKRIQDLERLQ